MVLMILIAPIDDVMVYDIKSSIIDFIDYSMDIKSSITQTIH